MCKKKAFTALFSLALAGSLAVPAWAAELPQTNLVFPADENPLTRAELITVLYEQEGKPAVHFDMDYTDVEPNADYAEAIRWASSEGVASGYGNGAFGPDDAVTREQMAVILYRYAQSNNQGFTGNWAFLLPYSDADVISGFAYEAVCWVTMKDLMGDVSDNCFAPKETVLHQDAYLLIEQSFGDTEQTEIANPFVSCKSMEEAAQIAGFSMDIPDRILDASAIRAVEGSMIEVLYSGDEGQITLRKGAGTGDISGDYNPYAETGVAEINGATVTWKGNDGKIMVATWENGGYTYAIQAEAGMEQATMLSMVSEIK